MHVVPGWDHVDPVQFREKVAKDFERYGSLKVEKVEIQRLKKREDGLFEARSGDNTWTGKKVILATGVQDIYPGIPGYAECWVSGM